ncbi:MAG: septation ring formation regulator EzrA [Bacilli bacterium]|nr:septation ring formation regulator EzrA [Bacilli bacterium]
MDNLTLIMLTLFLICAGLIIGILNFIQSRKNKKFKKTLEKLEIEKNKLATSPIVPELAKVESYLKNDKLKALYDEWSNRLNQIKEVQIPRLSDMILDAEYSLSQMDYKSTMYKIAKLEMELYKVRTNSDFLFGEIKDLTSSEERSRTIITGYKARYRTLFHKFEETKNDFGEFANLVNTQFEVIAKKFEEFEAIMDNNEYTEVDSVLNEIDELLNHMAVVVEEIPSITIMVTSVLPKKMQEVETIYNEMVNEGYPLDYLNVEYNLKEINGKIEQIVERTRKLDMNESLVELKVLMDYFENIFKDFEKEKVDRKTYEDKLLVFNTKLTKMNDLVDDIFNQIEEIKNIYDLKEEDIASLNEIRSELYDLNTNFKVLQDHTKFNNTFAYSKLVKEVEGLSNNLSHTEEKLDNLLNVIGSMHDDEVRARQQLEEIKLVLKDSKLQMRDYRLPVIPDSYYVELNEANSAIKEIVKELDKKPITIDVLNTRVDTARDLVLKLYTKTKDLMKNAMFAEKAIVYGNRYRSSYEDLNNHLNLSERLFYNGEYKKSFELTINVLNKIEPGIYNKILDLYSSKEK